MSDRQREREILIKIVRWKRDDTEIPNLKRILYPSILQNKCTCLCICLSGWVEREIDSANEREREREREREIE